MKFFFCKKISHKINIIRVFYIGVVALKNADIKNRCFLFIIVRIKYFDNYVCVIYYHGPGDVHMI